MLERTLGVPIFQEQVMQLAVVAAGFTPGESRSAAARDGRVEAQGRPRASRAATARRHARQRLRRSVRRQIYQQILGFGEYGFPESHAASFALLVYVSAWLKCYEPAAFTCALLNSQPMGFYSPSQLTQDLRRHGVTILPADACVSDWECTLEATVKLQAPADNGVGNGHAASIRPAGASPRIVPGERLFGSCRQAD